MRRVAVSTASHGSIERLLRVAAQLCGGSYAAVTLGEGTGAVVIAHGVAPSDGLPRRAATLRRTDGGRLGSLVVHGEGCGADDARADAALEDLAALVVEQLEMRRAADLLAASEAKLRASEEKFRQLIERAPDAIVVRQGERVLYCNGAFLTLHGFARHEDVVGRSVLELVHPDVRDELRARILAGDLRPLAHRETQALRGDGRAIAVEVSTVRIDYDGAPATLAILRDLTERKRLEQQLLLTERLASVGTLASGVAHEINNPLAFVLTNVDFARGQLPEGEARAALDEAQNGAERVQRIVQSLKTLSSADDDRRGPVDVHHAIELAVSMAMNEIRLRSALRREYQTVPLVDGNEARLGQVFLNLIVNAVHAIPAGAPKDHAIVVATRVDEQGRVVVEVRDTGCGIAREVLPRIFDPFFTTKPVGIGTGLGLSICHGVVTSLGGEIAAESEPGRGSTFRVTLPARVDQPRSAPPSPSPPVAIATRRGRVLIIDDEPMIGSSIRRVLLADHDVDVSTSGAEALRLLADGARYDVILCDLMMPQMTGMDLFEHLEEQLPEQAERMVFLTGGTFTDRARAFVEERPTRVHHKPFPPAQLRKLVAQMLSA